MSPSGIGEHAEQFGFMRESFTAPPWPLFWWDRGPGVKAGSSVREASKPEAQPDCLILGELAGKMGLKLN